MIIIMTQKRENCRDGKRKDSLSLWDDYKS